MFMALFYLIGALSYFIAAIFTWESVSSKYGKPMAVTATAACIFCSTFCLGEGFKLLGGLNG